MVDGEGGVGEVVEQSWLRCLGNGGLHELNGWRGVCGRGCVRNGRVAGGHLSLYSSTRGANPALVGEC